MRRRSSGMTPSPIRAALAAGRLEQACPDCGRWEAAGHYCSGCFRPMTEADWYPNGDTARRASVAGKIGRTPLKRGRGRPRRDVAA